MHSETCLLEPVSLATKTNAVQVELGTLLKGKSSSFSLPLRNESGMAIEISKIESSCGCATTTRKLFAIQNGCKETLAFSVLKNSLGRFGVEIRLHEANGNVRRIVLSGVVRKDFEMTPSHLTIKSQGPQKHEVHLLSYGKRRIGQNCEISVDAGAANLMCDVVPIDDKSVCLRLTRVESEASGSVDDSGEIRVVLRGPDFHEQLLLPFESDSRLSVFPRFVCSTFNEEKMVIQFYLRGGNGAKIEEDDIRNAELRRDIGEGKFACLDTRLKSYRPVADNVVRAEYLVSDGLGEFQQREHIVISLPDSRTAAFFLMRPREE